MADVDWRQAPAWTASWVVNADGNAMWLSRCPVADGKLHGVPVDVFWEYAPLFGFPVDRWEQSLTYRWPVAGRPDDADLTKPNCGRKDDSEKPRMDLLLDMPDALEAVGRVLTAGAQKYAPGNWRHVPDLQRRYQAAAMRHELALSRGETHDPETGEHHLAHIACCVLFRLQMGLESSAKEAK